MKRILWLASWFPNRLDPLSGDFIERHAKAASICNDIFVLHVMKDNENKAIGPLFRETKVFNTQCSAEIIYYKTRFRKIRWMEALHSNFKFYKYFLQAIKSYIDEKGQPHCIHVHIALKAGLMALWAKKLFKIPYIVSEQWTGLCPEARPNLDDRGWLFRWLWKRVMKNASSWSAVSEYLGLAIQKRFSLKNFMVIPNIVDTDIFQPGNYLPEAFYFIHISLMNYQKNPEQLFQAVSIVKKTTTRPFKVFLIGELSPALNGLAEKLDILDHLETKATCPQEQLTAFVRQSRALILYSRFETFGCVIIEANACGLPVIVSDIPVLHENVVDGVTGVFVPLNDPTHLAEKMGWMMEHVKEFDGSTIRSLVKEKYSYSVAANLFDSLYNDIEKTRPSKD